jgi:hypothetical protein
LNFEFIIDFYKTSRITKQNKAKGNGLTNFLRAMSVEMLASIAVI